MICISKLTRNHELTQTQDGILDSAARKCICNKEGVLLTVTRETPNKGRKFWSCVIARCGFFEWDDEPTRSVSQGIMTPRTESFNPKSGPGSECYKVWTLVITIIHGFDCICSVTKLATGPKVSDQAWYC